MCFLVERAYRWWKPKGPQKNSGNKETAARGSEDRAARALARFRKAGQTVVNMRRVTTLLHKPGIGRVATGARTSAEAKLHRLASVKKLQSMLAGSETSMRREEDIHQTDHQERKRNLGSKTRSFVRRTYQAEHGRRTAGTEDAMALAAVRAVQNPLPLTSGMTRKRKGKKRGQKKKSGGESGSGGQGRRCPTPGLNR